MQQLEKSIELTLLSARHRPPCKWLRLPCRPAVCPYSPPACSTFSRPDTSTCSWTPPVAFRCNNRAYSCTWRTAWTGVQSSHDWDCIPSGTAGRGCPSDNACRGSSSARICRPPWSGRIGRSRSRRSGRTRTGGDTADTATSLPWHPAGQRPGPACNAAGSVGRDRRSYPEYNPAQTKQLHWYNRKVYRVLSVERNMTSTPINQSTHANPIAFTSNQSINLNHLTRIQSIGQSINRRKENPNNQSIKRMIEYQKNQSIE